jgi:hypothetical protein
VGAIFSWRNRNPKDDAGPMRERRSRFAAPPLLSLFATRDWAELLIMQALVFPKGKHDDLVDSMTYAISYLRSVCMADG